MAAGTIVLFGGLGMVIIPYVRPAGLSTFLLGNERLWLQLLIGLVVGFVTAKAAWQIVELPFLADTKRFFADLIGPIKLSIPQIVFISLCAGIGEELFFRGAIQPMLGIWVTSILFVLLHGYLNPFNVSLSIYGLYMVVVIGVLGLITEHIGIIAAMTAHSVIDVVLLKELSDAATSEDGESFEEGDSL